MLSRWNGLTGFYAASLFAVSLSFTAHANEIKEVVVQYPYAVVVSESDS